jgi:hypothetical protein
LDSALIAKLFLTAYGFFRPISRILGQFREDLASLSINLNCRDFLGQGRDDIDGPDESSVLLLQLRALELATKDPEESGFFGLRSSDPSAYSVRLLSAIVRQNHSLETARS